MQTPIGDPDCLPDDSLEWAHEHHDLLERIVTEFLCTGAWPPLSRLTRDLAREQRPLALRTIFWDMPKPLGFVEHNPERVVLTPFGLRMTYAGHKLLGGFIAILSLARERYTSDDEHPVITRADAAQGTVDSDPYVTALSEILRHAPFLGSGPGGPQDAWSREVTEDIVRYFDAARVDDYLRIRASELAMSPQFGWRRADVTIASLSSDGPANPDETQRSAHRSDQLSQGAASTIESDQRDVFICHATEDKDIARPLADALQHLGHNVWFDEYELTVGDSLNGSINRGLSRSSFGVVILSKHFFGKHWTKHELDGFVAREMVNGERVILPVWHGVDTSYLANVAPPLANRFAAKTDDGVDKIAEQISAAMRKLRAPNQSPSARA